jgi:hypothetical protein
MNPLLPRLHRRCPLCVLALAAVLTVVDAAPSQFRGQPPRPVGPPAQPNRPGPLPNQPRRGFVPPEPQGPFVWETVYTCSRCKAELGRGAAPPALTQCPHCGARFAGGNAVVAAGGPPPAAPRGLRKAFVYTVGVEGAVLAGLVLLGFVRLAADSLRVPTAPAEDGQSARGG